MNRKGAAIIFIVIIILIVGGVGGYFYFTLGPGGVDINKLEINLETLVIEQNLGDMKYVKTEDDGGEAVFLRARYTNDQVDKEVENMIYSGVYKNKKHFPESNYDWADNRVMVMVQDYKETISDGELSSFLQARVLHKDYSQRLIGSNQVYEINGQNIGEKMFIWKSFDKLLLVIPDSGAESSYSEEEMVFLTEIYLNFYPPN
jgi:hypothetical protein